MKCFGIWGEKSSVIIRLSLSLVSYDWTHSRIWDEGSRNCRLLLIIVVQIFVWALFFDWCNIEINRNAQTLFFYSSNFCLGLVRHAGLPCRASVLLLVPGKESRSFVPLKPGREMSNWVNCSLSFYIKWKKMWKREKKRKSFMWKRTHIQMFAKAAEKKLWMQEVCHKWGAIVHAKIANITTVSLLLCNFPQSHLINTIFTIFESIWKQSEARSPCFPLGVPLRKAAPAGALKAAQHHGCCSGALSPLLVQDACYCAVQPLLRGCWTFPFLWPRLWFFGQSQSLDRELVSL